MNMMIKMWNLLIEYKYCDCFLKYKSFKDDLIEYKCYRIKCTIKIKQNTNTNVKKPFFNE